MTRLVLVHGINQQGRSSAEIREEWLATLRRCLGKPTNWPFDHVSDVDAPFYGDTLSELTNTKARATAVAQSAGELPDDFAAFAAPALLEIARGIGVSDAEFLRERDGPAVAQGAGVHKESFKTLVRLIERISPLKGELALRLLAQAHAYLKRPHVAEEVDALVRPFLASSQPTIIVSHSLGTVVTYKLLREISASQAPTEVPLFLTLGSPLGIDVIRRSFPLPRKRPANVSQWINAADPSDFVALRPALDEQSFGSGIVNMADVKNQDDDPHAISGYLSDPRIAELIADAIAG